MTIIRNKEDLENKIASIELTEENIYLLGYLKGATLESLGIAEKASDKMMVSILSKVYDMLNELYDPYKQEEEE